MDTPVSSLRIDSVIQSRKDSKVVSEFLQWLQPIRQFVIRADPLRKEQLWQML